MPPMSIFSTISTLLCFTSALLKLTTPTNTLYPNQPIRDGQRLVSANGLFTLGFFSPGKSTDRYVGIWVGPQFSDNREVWVANRNSPVPATSGSGVFTLLPNLNLALLHQNQSLVWKTNISHTPSKGPALAALLDTGNLVVSEGKSERILWQSFDHPVDVLLPGMKIGVDLRTGEAKMLVSWRSESNPAPGKFSFGIDPGGLNNQFFIYRRSIPFWRAVFWNGTSYDVVTTSPQCKSLINFQLVHDVYEVYFTYKNPAPQSETTTTYLVMQPEGNIDCITAENGRISAESWTGRIDECSRKGGCGQFSSCNVNSRPVCRCLPGFEPNSENPSRGCHRKLSNFQCGREDGMISLKKVEVDLSGTTNLGRLNEEECKRWCLSEDCNCKGSAFLLNSSVCYVWQGEDLQDVREESEGEGGMLMDVNIRVPASVSNLTGRQCNYCGANIIPYPLSTNPNCGDPNYTSLVCDASNDQLLFHTISGSYPIININSTSRTLVIKLEGSDLCWARSPKRRDIHLNTSQPFHVSNNNIILLFNCSTTEHSDLKCSSSTVCQRYISEGRAPCFDSKNCCSYVAGDMPSTSHRVGILSSGCNAYSAVANRNLSLPTYDWWEGVEISWDAPLEPICRVPEDCLAWPNSMCSPDKEMATRKRCLCTNRYHWDSLVMGCVLDANKHGMDSSVKKLLVIMSITVVACMVLSGILFYRFWSKMTKKTGDLNTRSLDLGNLGETYGEDVLTPYFDFKSVLAATENFADTNKLGGGGFGPVYKGKFPGQVLAVKRLSRNSGQGLEQFKNEVMLIARLQHRNLVRLLGYCIEGDERILLYEYMPNKSLDCILFDQNKCLMLNWELRYNVILGIARGLLYLHEDSRLRIIHRDLKTGNILLDEEMTPKISDFGMARIFGGNQIQENTNRVMGTYGYMSPEYALHGIFSVKSDVFSFGVILLEILSGIRNSLFDDSEHSLSLIGHAWQLWKEGKWMELLTKSLHGECNAYQVQKCINIALLCLQENPTDRPSMASVVAMFMSETITAQTPKQPAYVMTIPIDSDYSIVSRNDLTFSAIECR